MPLSTSVLDSPGLPRAFIQDRYLLEFSGLLDTVAGARHL